MDKLKLTRAVIRIVVGMSVGGLVGNIIKSNTPVTISVLNRIGNGIGGFVLASMVADKGAQYFDTIVGEVIEGYNERLDVTVEIRR